MNKVIAGPAGHWYALFTDPQFGQTLMGKPMMRDDDPADLPEFPADDVEAMCAEGWYEITDPAPECDDQAIIAELAAS